MEVKTQSLYKQKFEIEEQIGKQSKHSFIRIRGWILIAVTLSLCIFSLLNIASASFYTSMKMYKTEYFFVKRQLIFLITGFVIMIVGIVIDYRWYKSKFAMRIIVITTFIMFGIVALGTMLELDSIVPLVNGSRRWINLKFTRIQPSELLKIAYIIILAKGLEACKKNGYKNLEIIVTIFPFVLFFVLSVFLQRDLGTSLHYIAIVVVMVFFAEIELKYIFRVVLCVFIIGMLYGSYAYFLGNNTSYRNRRIKAYINGVIYDDYDNGDGYQIKQSLIAIGNGGVIGKGLGNGTQKYSYLPEIHTDFILSSIGEEWGFLGLFIMFMAYIIVLQIGIAIAKSTKDEFGRYLAIGIVGYFFTQIIMNVYVGTGLMPVTGIPLPLMSYGGTSLWTALFTIGILYNINRQSIRSDTKDAD